MDDRGGLGNINESPPLDAPTPRDVHMKFPAAEGSSLNTRPATGGLGTLRSGWKRLMQGTIFSSVFTLLSTCIGAGTLSLPYAFQQVRLCVDF